MVICYQSNCETAWQEFLHCVEDKCSATAFNNWLAPIQVIEASDQEITLEVPNIFVKEYLIDNYLNELCAFLPLRAPSEPAIHFVIAKRELKNNSPTPSDPLLGTSTPLDKTPAASPETQLNRLYTFENFIEGPSNQFVKSAAIGVATRPGQSYNPLFIHGPVGLGKTHLLHSIGHYIKEHNRSLNVHCITTEAFINDLVENLRNKSVDKMKRFYRTLDVLLVDDIQFLQNRLNFEDEFCNTFEVLINQNKQIVITSDKPPSQLKLSERIIARMEWGLVAHIGVPDLETRVAIIQHKAELRGFRIPSQTAFFIAEHIFHNVRQLEGAINRLSAHCRLLNQEITHELVEKTLSEIMQQVPRKRVSIESILKGVATSFQVKLSDLKGSNRTKDIALARQVAMYLAKEMIHDSLIMIGAAFGKTHSTILHACKNIEQKISLEESLKRQIDSIRKSLPA